MEQELLHKGKAKSVYACDDRTQVVIEYRDDATAFNGEKKAALTDKGRVNNYFNAYMMEKLESHGIKTHFLKRLNDRQSLMKKLEIIPVECVIRNVAAGGICKRLGIEKGMPFTTPIFEYFLKDDALGDPMINRSHILSFQWATETELDTMQQETIKINNIFRAFFNAAGFTLVDFKLEFGRYNHQVILGDEFTLDGCRLWDKTTQESFDKDRFRQDLGEVIDHYKAVAKRIGLAL